MSDQDSATIEAEVPGDWLDMTGVLVGLLDHARDLDKSQPTWNGGPDVAWKGDPKADGYKMTIYAGAGIGRITADVWLCGDEAACQIRITTTRADMPYWEDKIALLNKIALEMRSVRRMVEPKAWDLVEFFYRSRAAGSRTTLRQLAEQHRLNYSYLRAVKADYDKAGGWGSKKSKTLGGT